MSPNLSKSQLRVPCPAAGRHHRGGGIYLITNLASGRIYIGSSSHCQERISDHLRNLKSGRHPIVAMQADADRHGVQSFVFEVIEVTSWTQGDDDKSSRIAAENATIFLARPAYNQGHVNDYMIRQMAASAS